MNMAAFELSKKETNALALEVQRQLARRQSVLLRIPVVMYQVISDLSLGVNSEQNSFLHLLSEIEHEGKWMPINQVGHSDVVAVVKQVLAQLESSYSQAMSYKALYDTRDGVADIAQKQAIKAFGVLQLSDLYLKRFFPLANKRSGNACEAVVSEFADAQSKLNSAIEKMMELNEFSFRDIVRRYTIGTVNREDLIAEASEGFYRACVKYRPGAGAEFYAVLKNWVMAKVVAFLDRNSSMLSIGTKTGSFYREIKRARRDMEADGKVVTMSSLASRIGVDRQVVQECESAFPLTAEIDQVAHTLVDESCFVQPDKVQMKADDRALVMDLLSQLTRKEATIIAGRYGIGGPEQTLQQLADQYGVSCEAIRQSQRKAEKKMSALAAHDAW